jgi:hypothetical protein
VNVLILDVGTAEESRPSDVVVNRAFTSKGARAAMIQGCADEHELTAADLADNGYFVIAHKVDGR